MDYRDPNIDPPGVFDGTTFFMTFYENSVETHIPPTGTFLEIFTNSTQNAYLYYFDTVSNKWTKNCVDPSINNDKLIFTLCHASQYAIFHMTFSSASSNKPADISVIVIIIVVLVVVIAGLGGAIVFYRKKVGMVLVGTNWV